MILGLSQWYRYIALRRWSYGAARTHTQRACTMPSSKAKGVKHLRSAPRDTQLKSPASSRPSTVEYTLCRLAEQCWGQMEGH